MISLIQVVKLLSLDNSDFVYFCEKPGAFVDVGMSIKSMRKFLDMKNVHVKHIGTHHHWCSYDESLEFIVSHKDFEYIYNIAKNKYCLF